MRHLRTVPTSVSRQMFCAHASMVYRHTRAMGNIDVINFTTKVTTKMKGKFSCCDQIKCKEPALKPGIPE